jgi:hypothetical protein
LASVSRPIPTLFPTGLVMVSTLADRFLYLKPIPRARLTHRPDDGRSKVLWNTGKFLPDYTALQPIRQPSSYQPPRKPQVLRKYIISKTIINIIITIKMILHMHSPKNILMDLCIK